MYKVRTITYTTLWGDQRLYDYDGDSTKENIGIVYTVSGIDTFNCRIENEVECTTLKEAINKNPGKFGLLKGEEYPVIIAFDSCKESVSFQIHPTDTYAKNQLNLLYGKSEAWYFIEPPTDGWVYGETSSNEAVQKALQEHTIQSVVEHKPVNQNDLVYIRSGTIHALTKGSLIYEIQQSTNITYRFYDYDRIDSRTGQMRPLHIQQSLDNLDSSLKIKTQSFPSETKAINREFDLTHTILKETYTNNGSIASAISVVSGTLIINHVTVNPGQSVLVLPQETVSIQQEAEVIIADCHPYWRKKG